MARNKIDRDMNEGYRELRDIHVHRIHTAELWSLQKHTDKTKRLAERCCR